MTVSAVLFDWDSTLVDSSRTIFNALNETLVAFGREPWTPKEMRERTQRSGREGFPLFFKDQWEEASHFFTQAVTRTHLQELQPLPEALELLQTLKDADVPVGIVSNKQSPLLRKEIHHLGWEPWIDVIVGAGDAALDKPAPDPALLALETLKIPASTAVWFVGDTPVDWACATAAGCKPFAIGNHHTPDEALLAGSEISPEITREIISVANCTALRNFFLNL